MPWILQVHKQNGSGEVKPQYTRIGKKQFKRFRHAEQGHEEESVKIQKHKQSWKMLHQLGGRYLDRFQVSRKLRRACTEPLMLYYWYRMAGHMDEPFKSRAIRELTKILKSRSLAIPRTPRPALIPFLDHKDF
jgi:hypothetical protein